MRALIYGAGAMGTILGAYLTRGGADIELVTRNLAHVEAMKKDGAHIVGSVDFIQPVTALTPDEMTGKYDIIFLMTKQRQNAEICKFLLGYLSDGGVICTTQNGLPELSVAEVVGKERCLGCAISWGATFVGAGISRLTSDQSALTFALGSIFGYNPAAEEVARLLSLMGEVTVEKNFIGARWAKLAINSAFSSLSALTGLTFGEVASGKTSKKIALGLLNEAFSVAKAGGVKLEKIQGHDIVKIYGCRGGIKRAVALALLPKAMKRHKNLVSGMYFDLAAGRRCDIDFINGAVAKEGARLGVSTPLNDKVISIAREIEEGKSQISTENLQEF